MEGGRSSRKGEGIRNHVTCPGSNKRMEWINFGNRPHSNPYPACVVCLRGDLDFDHMFRAEDH